MNGVDMDELTKAIDEELMRGIPPRKGRLPGPFRWIGGKGLLVPWLLHHLPPRERVGVYVEPYAGAANLLFALPEPYPVEVLNDLDKRIANLYRVLQDPTLFRELAHRLLWTPYAREEFVRALEVLERWDEHTSVERAWAFFVAQNQGFGGVAETQGRWGRVFTSRGNQAETTSRWSSRLASLVSWHQRLLRVQIDSRDALEVIRYWDSPETFFYVDPPYWGKSVYYEVGEGDGHHEALVDLLLEVRGMVLLSGYDAPPYRRLEEAGWWRKEKRTSAYSAGRIRGSDLRGAGSAREKVARVEVLWGNYPLENSALLL